MNDRSFLLIVLIAMLIAFFFFRVFMLPVFIITNTDIPYFGCYSSNKTIDSLNIKSKHCFSFLGNIKVNSVITNKKDSDTFLSYTLIPKRIDLRNSIVEYAIQDYHAYPKTKQFEKYQGIVGEIQIKVTQEKKQKGLIYKSQLLNGDNDIEVLVPW